MTKQQKLKKKVIQWKKNLGDPFPYIDVKEEIDYCPKGIGPHDEPHRCSFLHCNNCGLCDEQANKRTKT